MSIMTKLMLFMAQNNQAVDQIAQPRRRCELANAVAPAVNWVGGNALGLIVPLAVAAVLVFSVVIIAVSRSNKVKGWMTALGIVMVVVLGVTVLPNVIQAAGPASC